MKRSGVKYRDAIRILKQNGWVRGDGSGTSHQKFFKDGRHISIPLGHEVNAMMFRRLCKENGIPC